MRMYNFIPFTVYIADFKNIPVGANTQLIAFSIKKNGKPYAYKSDLIIKPDETISLKLKEVSHDEVRALFN